MTVSLYRQVLQDRQDVFNAALANGVYTPFLLPWDLLPVASLITGVLFTPRLSKNMAVASRWILTLTTFVYVVERWPYVRTAGLTSGYGIGLTGFWGLIATAVLLLFHDPGKDFRRIEVREANAPNLDSSKQVNGHSKSMHDETLRKRSDAGPTMNEVKAVDSMSSARTLVWQSRPEEFWHLLDWTADLITSFRGPNWNWCIPMRTYIMQPPEGDPPRLSAQAEKSRTAAMKQLQRSAIIRFLCYYILIDLWKTMMITDPYFLGIAPLNSPSTWPWLVILNEVLPIATRFVRLSLCLSSVVIALTIIFSLNPLFWGAVLPYLLGDRLYAVTKTPLLEAWMYPAQWGSFWESLCSKGLAGMWGQWWHQMFRYGISVPSATLNKKLGISQRSQLGRFLQLTIAFTLTGGIHAAASSTTFSLVPSKPWNAFSFFFAQGAGILVQTEISKQLNQRLHFSRTVRRMGNFAFVFIFMWYVGPLLSDDFARCQIWLFEPVPISIFRGLGYGPGDCWIPWLQFAEGGKWIGWWNRGYLRGIGIY